MPQGGARKGAGRKPKAEEEHSRKRIINALKVIYAESDNEEAITKFLVKFGATRDGMKFFAEHLLGKAPERIELEQKGKENTPLIKWVKST